MAQLTKMQQKIYDYIVQAIQERQGVLVACLEEIAFRMGYIDAAQVERLAKDMLKNDYGQYLMDMIHEA